MLPELALTRRQLGALTAVAAGSVMIGLAGTAAAPGCHTDPTASKHQFRALWIASVVNIDWPSAIGLEAQQQRAELTGWFDMAVRLRLNAVILQVRPTADAFWPSRYEPWSRYLTGRQGVDPGYDPLAFAAAEAHRRNLELHAWFNPYRVSMQADPEQLVPEHPARRHPDWVFTYGRKLYYNPGIPDVRRFVGDAILDAVTRYDIDGAHFDDYFYPYPIAGQALPDADTFARYGTRFDSVADWRRDNVNKLVSEVGQRVHHAKPWVKFGISPFGIWRNRTTDPRGSDTGGFQSYDGISADTRLWVKNGWVDYINPQLYWNIGQPVADYAKLVPWWNDQVDGTDVQLYIGETTYKVGTAGAWSNPAELSSHLTFDRDYSGVTGNVYFSATNVRTHALGAMSQLAAEHYRHPAITPPMDHLWRDRPPVHAPALTDARRTGAGVELRWKPESAHWPTSYAVYGFDGQVHVQDCDFADAAHLLATVRDRWFVDATAIASRTYTYYVTVLDPGHNGASAAHPVEINRQVPNGRGGTKACNTTGTSTDGGYPEHAFNWDVALRVRDALTARGVRVVLTRPDDAGVGPCVNDRAAIANRASAEAMVSIHADGAAPSGHGFHVAYSDPPLNASQGPPSVALAEALVEALRGDGFTTADYISSNGLYPRPDLAGLNLAQIPAALVECANMRNPQEAALVSTPRGRARYATAIADGIMAWLIAQAVALRRKGGS